MAKPIAFVTGVGPGTGRAIVKRFTAGGYRVAMLARNRERLDALAKEMTDALPIACDVADETQVCSAVAAVRDTLGAPEVLIHNARRRLVRQFPRRRSRHPQSELPNQHDGAFVSRPAAGAGDEIFHVVHQKPSAWSFNVEIRPSGEPW